MRAGRRNSEWPVIRGRARLASALVAIAILLAAGGAHAGSEERKATAGAPELLIPMGPRGSALGIATAGDIEGIDALYWNPAGLAGVHGTEALFTHTIYFAGMNVNAGAVGAKFENLGTVAVSARVLSIGDLIETTEDAPEGTGKVFDPTFSILGFSYARQFTDRVRFGVTANIISERVLDVSARGIAFDLAAQYHAGWRGVAFGLVMKNFGPKMKYDGSGLQVTLPRPDADPTANARSFQTTSASFDLPSYFVLSAGYDLYNQGRHRVSLKSAFQNNSYFGDNLCGAVEWIYAGTLSLRGSYFGSFRGVTDPLTGNQSGAFGSGDDLYSGPAIGVGVLVPAGGSRFRLDLTWRPVRNLFDDVYEFGLTAGL